MRLDNIVFRLGFAQTIAAARQLISHGHIIVNKHRINIPSYICKIDDEISVSATSTSFVKKSIERFSSVLDTSHLEINSEKLSARVLNTVSREAVGLQINELLVVEFYSRKI